MISLQNVIIFYNNLDDITAYLDEVEKQELDNVNLVVTIVMNKYTNEENKLLSKIIDNYKFSIELIFPKENLGYLNGLLFGYRNSNHRNSEFKWVIFSNTDIVIPSKKFFSSFATTEYPKDIFCVGPSVYVPTSHVYSNPQYKERYTKESIEKRIKIFKNRYLSSLYLNLSNMKSRIFRRKKESSSYVYSTHGSYFMLRESFLHNLNKDYMSILYSEETFIAEEVRIANGKIYYDSSIEVEHHENKVTGKLGKRKQADYIAESLEKIVKEYF